MTALEFLDRCVVPAYLLRLEVGITV
jgi:hypothetical protein